VITLKVLLRRYPVTSFFALTFTLSWSMFILALQLFPENELYRAPLVSVGAFTPALVSIFLSALIDPGRKPGKKHVRATVFISSWITSWFNLILFASLVRGLPLNILLIAAGALMALLPATIISGAFFRNAGVKEHLSSLVRPRGHPGWYMLAVSLIPFLLFLGKAISSAIGKGLPEAQYSIEGKGAPMVIVMISLIFLSNLINSGGAAEEPGWRGFALRRLQMRLSPLVAGLFIGFIWGLWHIPMMFAQLRTSGPILVLFQVAQLGIAFTWFYNRAQGSILVVALLHASWNAGVGLIPRTDAFHILMAGVLIMMVYFDRMWKKKKGEAYEI
jgi:membrane protease YdiL (CAAX protease family)